MPIRRFVTFAHRWIGLATSAVLVVVAGTGAVIVWPGDGLLHRAAGRFHDTLALGRIGAWIVLIATACAVLLQVSGLYLWWRRKIFTVRTQQGWRTALGDLHHVAGLFGLVLMLTLAVSALGITFIAPATMPGLRRVVAQVHTAREFPVTLKLLSTIGAAAFLVQGVTGVATWWRPAKR